ncbi:MAG: hypothetical protein M9949_14600 [Candidatus Kapabacteria bacterium]|nr:hypothetical protein [Candidatus Kapabacteria bacterium]
MMVRLFILLLFVSVLGGCQDPASVDATRYKEVKYDPNDVPANFLITPANIITNVIRPNQVYEIDLTMTNITDQQVIVLDANFPKLKTLTSFIGLYFPVTLEKEFTTGYTKDFKLRFQSNESGHYHDTLVYPTHKNPKVILTAKVAHVYADDLAFEDTQVNQFSLKIFQIRNNSAVVATITEFELIDAEGNFINEPEVSLPLPINPQSNSEDIRIAFNPTKSGLHNAKIKFKVEFESGDNWYYYDQIEISGNGN